MRLFQNNIPKISVIDPTIDKRWDQFITNQEHSTIFHTSAWARVIRETYGYLPQYYVMENEEGEFTASLPFFLVGSRLTGKRLVCLPFSDYCYALGKENEVGGLLESVKTKCQNKGISYLEIRGFQAENIPDDSSLISYNDYSLFITDLEPDPENLKKRLHRNVRSGIRQAQERDIIVHTSRTEDAMRTFYLLNCITRQKVGAFPQPERFFKSIYHHLILPELGLLMLAESDNKIIAGILLLNHKDTLYCKINVSDPNYLMKRPNHLLFWKAMEYACTKGYRYFDFGRAGEDQSELQRFKSLWAARKIELPYYYYPKVNGITLDKSKIKHKAMNLAAGILPGPIFRAVGSVAYKHLG